MTDHDTTDRLDRLESLVERQGAAVDALTARLAELDDDGTEADDTLGPPVTRRTALKAGGLLALLGAGAGTASADPQGQVGTDDDPLRVLYAEELNGGITGGRPLRSVAGTGLTVRTGELRPTRLPAYDAVGDDPEATIEAMQGAFDGPRWGDPAPVGRLAPRTASGTEPTGGRKGAVVVPTGEVVTIPYADSGSIDPGIGIYDPVTDTYRTGPTHGEGGDAFNGGALTPTGEVVFAPENSAHVGVYDHAAGTYTSGPAHGEGASAFAGAVLAPTGEVIFAPDDSANVGVYDHAAGTYTPGPAHGEGASAFRGAALSPTGTVILVPYDADHVGVYDPATGTYESGPAHGEGGSAFNGAALAPTGEVVFAPENSDHVGVYDPMTNAYESGPAHGEGDFAFRGATLTPTGEVVFAPQTGSVGVYRPSDGTYSAGTGLPTIAHWGGALTQTGTIVWANDLSGDLSATETKIPMDLRTVLHPLVNYS